MARVKKPEIHVQLKGGALIPTTAYDADRLGDYKEGEIFSIKTTRGRSVPQLGKYFLILRQVCRSTGRWDNEYELHDQLKLACGLYTIGVNKVDGSYYKVPSSVSFEEMEQQEFNRYFDDAMIALAAAIGYDPTEQ